jgi:hypothetical protein
MSGEEWRQRKEHDATCVPGCRIDVDEVELVERAVDSSNGHSDFSVGDRTGGRARGVRSSHGARAYLIVCSYAYCRRVGVECDGGTAWCDVVGRVLVGRFARCCDRSSR